MNFNAYLLATTPKGSETLVFVAYFVIIIGVMYFMLIRPQRKRTKEEKQLRESLQVGDEIVSIGGIYGRIISLKEDTVVIESKSDHSKLTIARWAIQTNLTKHEEKKAEKKAVTSKEKKEEKKPAKDDKKQEKVDGKLN